MLKLKSIVISLVKPGITWSIMNLKIHMKKNHSRKKLTYILRGEILKSTEK
jgi:hypothetical protein